MLILYILAMSAIAFCMFAWDKYCAINGLWRIPERTLLLVAAAGGTPGAFAGQKVLRHKTLKQPFGNYLLIIAALQIVAILLLGISSGGALVALLLV
jgi:uncharacterized membrane protein YsdA (DUF1294 family)